MSRAGRGSLAWLGLLALIGLAACASPRPLTAGSHAAERAGPPLSGSVLVWGNHQEAEQAVAAWLREKGYRVLERVSGGAAPEDAQDRAEAALRLGRTLKAGALVLVEVTMGSHGVYWGYAGHWEGVERNVNTLYAPAVAVRGVEVQRGTVLWTAAATYQDPGFQPDRRVVELARVAIERGVCEGDQGRAWDDEAGCVAQPAP